jgi:hypothetical protein
MLIKLIDVGNLDLQVNPDADARVREFFSMRLLRMQHEREVAESQDGEAVWCSLFLGVELNDVCPDDLVVKLQRPANVLDIKEDARDTGRHYNPLWLRPVRITNGNAFTGD